MSGVTKFFLKNVKFGQNPVVLINHEMSLNFGSNPPKRVIEQKRIKNYKYKYFSKIWKFSMYVRGHKIFLKNVKFGQNPVVLINHEMSLNFGSNPPKRVIEQKRIKNYKYKYFSKIWKFSMYVRGHKIFF